MLLTLNRQLERFLPLITPVSVILGVVFATHLNEFVYLIPWIFAFMTFSGSLGSNFKSVTTALSKPFPFFIAFTILHLFMPLWALGIGHISFPNDQYTITGLLLAMVIPTGITSFLWVSIYRGNIPLTLSIILIDTLLSPIIVPYSLSILVGAKVEMDIFLIMKGLFGMIVIPSILGMALNEITKGRIKPILGPRLAPFSKIGLGLVVMINGAVVAPYLSKLSAKLVLIAVIVFIIAFSGYLIAFMLGVLLKRDRETIITLTFTGGMRNISAGSVIAITYFPAPVAVPVVVGMLFQQVLASIFGYFLKQYFYKKDPLVKVLA